MKIRSISFLLTLLALTTLSFKIDETPLEKLLKQLVKLTATYPQEKVHLHLDKPYYTVGEDIWLKAYLVTAEKNEPSLLSNVLYVDLIDDKNEVRKKLTLSLTKGFGSGNISLIDSLSSGNYRVRAYTNYMRNYSDGYFFDKFITIGNVLDVPKADKSKQQKQKLSLQFFPEGGTLINGIRSKIGVKAVTADGLGANVTGYIENGRKEKVTNFSMQHAGMGVFALVPQIGEKYTAFVNMPDGSTQSFNLPKADDEGYSLAVNAANDNVSIRIGASSKLQDGKDVYVVAQANGVVYASFASKADKGILLANIPKKTFPTGIVQFTLFNSESSPVAERLVFINHNDALKIDVQNSQAQSLIKSKADLAVKVTDITGASVDGSFSVSVTDNSKVKLNEDHETTILSNLLLTSDLRGYIEQPNFYFNEANGERESQLDYLLLTQGFRRFTWQDVISDKEPNITFRPEQSLEITGKITSLGNKPLPNSKVIMFSNTVGYTFMLDTLTDARGNFVFDRLEIPDSASFIIQSKTVKDSKNNNLVVSSTAKVTPVNYIGNTVDIMPYVQSTKELFKELDKFNRLDKGISLNAVNISGKAPLKPFLNVKSSANASGAADRVITKEMLEKEIDIFSVFYKVSGVTVNKGKIFRRKLDNSLTARKSPMLLIVDGVQISQEEQPEYISSINIKDLEGIEVLTSNYNLSVYGPDGGAGVIHLTTKNGPGPPPPNTNIVKLKNRGFTLTKLFYAPDYDDPKTNRQMLDLRSTIYWNPNLQTDENGRANFSFFNAGSPATYRVTIEGIDAFGNIGRKVYTYQVK